MINKIQNAIVGSYNKGEYEGGFDRKNERSKWFRSKKVKRSLKKKINRKTEVFKDDE